MSLGPSARRCAPASRPPRRLGGRRRKGSGGETARASTLAEWLARRRLEDVLATLARDVDVPVGVLIACHAAPTPHALTMIVRGLGHPWSLLKALLQAAAGGAVSPECLGVAHRLHFEIAPRTARMVARSASIPSGTGAFLAAAASDDGAPVAPVARASVGGV